MKQNIIEINREHVQIERERDMWRMRAEHPGVISYDTFPLLKAERSQCDSARHGTAPSPRPWW
jgi:hypothetical protein